MDHNLKHKKNLLAQGQRIAFISAMLIFGLALVKALVGHFFNSALLIADAWHSGADILINISSLVGLKLASRKKSSLFPYGLYRAETVASLLIGGLILYVGIDLFQDGRQRLFAPVLEQKFPLMPILVSAISCGISILLAVKQKTIGSAIGSQALLATAREAFFDIFTSLFVLAGIMFAFIRVPYVEGTVIIIIACLIVKLGLETAWKAILILMDANLDAALKDEIETTLQEIKGIQGVEDVTVRQAGPFKMVSCKIKTSASLKLFQSHGLADTAESLLLERYKDIESVFIHVEPEKGETLYAVIPVGDKAGLDGQVFDQFGKAPYFARLIIEKNSVNIDCYFENQHLSEKGHVGLNVVKSILAEPLHLLFVSSIGEISFHMLKNNYVDVFKIDPQMTVGQVVDAYRGKKLKPITTPGKSKRKF